MEDPQLVPYGTMLSTIGPPPPRLILIPFLPHLSVYPILPPLFFSFFAVVYLSTCNTILSPDICHLRSLPLFPLLRSLSDVSCRTTNPHSLFSIHSSICPLFLYISVPF